MRRRRQSLTQIRDGIPPIGQEYTKNRWIRDLVVESGNISCVPGYLEEVQANRVPPDLVLIDFSMGSSKNFDLAMEAAKAVDLVVIPCHPTLSDVWAIDAPVRAASESQTPTLVVTSAILGRNRWQKDAENYLSKRLTSYPNTEKVPIKLENYEGVLSAHWIKEQFRRCLIIVHR